MPKIKTLDQELVTDAGKPLTMSVPYNAYPRAEAEWFFDNVSLPNENVQTSPDKTEYRLKDPKKSDEGRYKVVIKNKHGQGEAFIQLKVVGEFKFNCSIKNGAGALVGRILVSGPRAHGFESWVPGEDP